MPTFSRLRAGIMFAVVATLLAGMTARVAYLQTYGRQRTVRSAERQQHTTIPILARRGGIFDRNGHQMVGSVQSLTVYIDPKFLRDQYKTEKYAQRQIEADLRQLAELVDCKPSELLDLIKEKSDKRFVKIAEDQPERVGEEITRLGIPGVGVQPVAVRYYPMGSLAAHVVGAVDADGNGLEGLELRFQQDLAGQNGLKRFGKDARRRPISVDEGDYIQPVHGKQLVLTIDTNIQMLAEQELEDVCRKFEAERGEAIVMDPYTGEILALANWPTFNPEDTAAPPELRRNASLVMPYEPGSIFKPFIVGPALQNRYTTIDRVWPTRAGVFVDPHGRRVSDVHPSGAQLCTWDVIVKSSNQGMTMISEHMGNAALYKAITSFGFGQRTGIELPGEDEGRLYPLRKWSYDSTPSIAQGYYVMVTPIQLARAYCVYANGGRLVEPHIVKGWLDSDGNVVERRRTKKLEELPQIVDEKTAETMRRMMADVMIRGTGRTARKECMYWNIFGKTGTAHISQGGVYQSNLFNSSFLCGAPVEKPRVVVAMSVHKPDRKHGVFGGVVSAPASAKLMKRVLAYMGVPQSPPPQPPPAEVIPHLDRYNPAVYREHAAAGE